MALDPSEAEAYGVAVRDVARHYKITQKFVGKWADWTNLIGCLAVIYGPRVYLIRKRLQDDDLERRARVTQPPRPQAAQTPMTPPGPQTATQAAPPTAPPPQQSPNGASTAAMPIPPLQAIDLEAFAAENANPQDAELLRRAQIKAAQGRTH